MNLVWMSHGEQLRADMERNIGGMTNFRGEMSRNQQQMGTWGQQMKAMATTVRYALAGAIVYGVAQAVGALSTFEDKLGQIDQLAATFDDRGRLRGLGDNLNTVADMALSTSNRLGIAVDDVETYMTRFYSSFEAPSGARGIAQMRGFVDQVAKLQLVLGGEAQDPQALAAGVAGFIQGMGPGATRNPGRSAERVSDIIAQVIKRSPVITGTDITRDIGRLGAAQTAMNMTPEQIFAVYGAASLRGGSGAVIGRGIAQLLTSSLLKPGTKQLQAFSQAGLPTDPNALRQMGGWNILMQLFKAVQTGPVSVGNANVLRSDSGMTDTEAISAANVQGINVTLASKLFGRVESLRQFLNLISVGGPKALNHFIDSIHTAEKNHLSNQMVDLRNAQRTLQIGANAQRNLNLQLIRGFDPVLHGLARAETGLSNLAIGHPDATQGAVVGAAGAQLASRMFLGTGLFGLAGRGIMKIPGIGRMLRDNPMTRRMFGAGLSRAGELGAASVIGSGLGAFSSTGKGTRSDPVWTVIDPLSWFMPGAPSEGMGGTGGPGGGSRVPKAFPAALRNWKAIGAGTALVTLPLTAHELQAHVNQQREDERQQRGLPKDAKQRFPLLYSLSRSEPRGTGLNLSGLRHPEPSKRQQDVLDTYINRLITASQAERQLRSLANGGEVSGEATVSVKLEGDDFIRRVFKNVEKELAVPVKLWSKASGGGKPQHRGKNKSTRGQSSR